MLKVGPLLTILPLFLLMVVGYLTRRTGLFDSEKAKVLNDLIIYLAIPCLIFRSVVDKEFILDRLYFVFVFILAMAIAGCAAYLLSRLFSVRKNILGVLLIGSFLGNTGYLGYPLSLTLLGTDALALAVYLDVLGTVLVLFTAGLYLVEWISGSSAQINKTNAILTFPPFWALFLGVVLHGFDIPITITKMIDLLADAAVPIIMLSIGINLRFSSLKHSFSAYLIGAVTKLVLMPLALLFIAGYVIRPASLAPDELSVLMLQASMPTAMMTQVLAVKYGLEAEFLPALIFITTLLSIVTVPVWMSIVR